MTKTTGYSYLPDLFLDPKTNSLVEIYRPMLEIRISKDHGQLSLPFDALVDSGSDRNLLPLYFGVQMGISFKKIKAKKIYGIGGEITAYPAKINIWVGTKKYETEADFSSEQKVPILGRQGFFNHFKSIRFDEKEKFFYIEE